MSDSIGKTLKAARTLKGLSIEQLSQLTHIKIRFLEAMENDQFDAIPSLVQVKGFLRLYADQVGLPTQALIDMANGKPDVSASAVPAPSQESPPEIVAETKSGSKISNLINKGNVFNPKRKKEAAGPVEPINPGVDLASTTTFKEIGQTIHLRREALGLSLADIEEYIHVRAFYLKCIEDGRIQDLPSLVQARGMLNNYLIFLDLDTEMVMLQFADGLQSLHFEKTGSHTNPKPKGKKQVSLPMGWRRFLTTDLILGGVVILVILGLVIWGAFQLTALSDSGTKSSNSSISDILMQTSPTVTGTEPANNSKMAPGVKPNNGQSGGGQNAPAPTGTLVFAGSGPLQINIVSNQRAYMRIIVDGKTVFDGRVLPGNAYPYSGTQEIELLTGNAGAFKVSTLINGTPNDMGSLGSVGEVKSLIFTNQGIITPTPKFTATATITPPATETPQVTNTPLNPTITPFIPQS